MNLLIVDDEMIAIQGILDDVPWEVLRFENIYTANSYAQAVNTFRSRKVDILLCDIEMPMGNGLSLVRWVKEHYEKVECIFLTCHADFDFAKQAIDLGCSGYILKPADTNEIVTVLQQAMTKLMSSQEKKFLEDYGKMYLNHMKEEVNESECRDVVDVAESYIQEHLSDQFSVDDLAETVHISTAHLGRLFKKKYNMTVVDYITEKRIELAKQLLKDTNLTVSAVASKAGYNNYSYFTRIFGKVTGMSPREFKAQKTQENM